MNWRLRTGIDDDAFEVPEVSLGCRKIPSTMH